MKKFFLFGFLGFSVLFPVLSFAVCEPGYWQEWENNPGIPPGSGYCDLGGGNHTCPPGTYLDGGTALCFPTPGYVCTLGECSLPGHAYFSFVTLDIVTVLDAVMTTMFVLLSLLFVFRKSVKALNRS